MLMVLTLLRLSRGTLKCCSFPFIKGKLAAFEEAEAWTERLAEFNGCTGAQLEVAMAAGEDSMQEYIENDVGRGAHSIKMPLNIAGNASAVTTNITVAWLLEGAGAGANIYDAYIVQAPWLPGVQSNLEDMSPWVKETGSHLLGVLVRRFCVLNCEGLNPTLCVRPRSGLQGIPAPPSSLHSQT